MRRELDGGDILTHLRELTCNIDSIEINQISPMPVVILCVEPEKAFGFSQKGKLI